MKARIMVAGLMLALLAACSSPGARKSDESNEVLMTPPTAAEDPFFYLARPPVEARAEAAGTIGDAPKKAGGKKPRDGKAERTTGAEEDRLRHENTMAVAERNEAESRAVELRAENLALKSELDEARRRAAALEKKASEAPVVTRSNLRQCHACVRLCPIKGSCADDAELVCGWGAGKKTKDAMLRATAECDGALESMRKSGAFSRIEGKCPVASCVD